MPTLNTYQIPTAREDLSDVLSDISPEDHPILDAIGSTKASGKYHEWSQDELGAIDISAGAVDGADAVSATLVAPVRLGNYTEIRTKTVQVAGTARAIEVASIKDMMPYQVAKGMAELKRSKEALIASAHASNAGSGSTPRALGGAEAWIKTNALHGAGGSTAGFSGNTVGSVTAGTLRNLTEALYLDGIQKAWVAGGNVTKTFAPAPLKEKISQFTGNATKQQQAKDKTITGAVDYYVGNFGKQQIIPHRWMSTTTVLALDVSLWNVAVLRAMKANDIAKLGDSDRKQLIEEYTLECLNEKGNAKIADVQ
ncbi:DUF5309 family protein [Rhizobium sp. L43]|uniref:SU10 major capsid protein n=1 Tax=Rhizobium sp. L43 TaxID=2035452 RepID=UPI000BEAA9FE|nr:DUF5309 family protein [Rhizobium sp. L43]PDS75439.1 head protein [Rhizobium sp. L43]